MKDINKILESSELQEAIDKFIYLNDIDTSSGETNDLVDSFIMGYIAALRLK